MQDKKIIFIAGLHRSGTSLLHEMICSHPRVSGFSDTGVPQDEGQFLQSVYPPARVFGGPGKFAFDRRAYMDDKHPLATPENASKIKAQWHSHTDMSGQYLVEKSPPNIIRTRFLQKLYPDCIFIVIIRHPVAVSYATQKWSKTSIASLLEHSLLTYELFFKDMTFLNSVFVLRYEDFVVEPQQMMERLFCYLRLHPILVTQAIRRNINEKYFLMWGNDQDKIRDTSLNNASEKLEAKVNQYGYSIKNINKLLPVPWLGEQMNKNIPT